MACFYKSFQVEETLFSVTKYEWKTVAYTFFQSAHNSHVAESQPVPADGHWIAARTSMTHLFIYLFIQTYLYRVKHY